MSVPGRGGGRAEGFGAGAASGAEEHAGWARSRPPSQDPRPADVPPGGVRGIPARRGAGGALKAPRHRPARPATPRWAMSVAVPLPGRPEVRPRGGGCSHGACPVALKPRGSHSAPAASPAVAVDPGGRARSGGTAARDSGPVLPFTCPDGGCQSAPTAPAAVVGPCRRDLRALEGARPLERCHFPSDQASAIGPRPREWCHFCQSGAAWYPRRQAGRVGRRARRAARPPARRPKADRRGAVAAARGAMAPADAIPAGAPARTGAPSLRQARRARCGQGRLRAAGAPG